MDEIDIWRSAAVMARHYGEEAELECALRADQAISRGDPQEETAWKRIMAAVRELQRQKPSASEPLN